MPDPEPLSESQPVSLSVDTRALMTQMRRRLQETANRTVVGLAALSEFPDNENLLPLTGAFVHTTFGEPPRSTPQSREDCKAWITGLALREGVDGLSILCEDIWRLASIVKKLSVAPVKIQTPLDYTQADLATLTNAVLGKSTRGIDHGGLIDKLNALHKDFGICLAWQGELESINRARNCLTHRLGIVGNKDLTDSANKTLLVRYRSHQINITTPDGSTESLVKPKFYEHGGKLSVDLGAVHEKSFPLGERVEFSAQEFMHLMLTFDGAGLELVQQISTFMARTSASAPQPPAAIPKTDTI